MKVLIFGIDGGTWTVLKPAMEKGYMPFLNSLVSSGAAGTLKSTIPAITPAAWGGFHTGKNPGKTGVFDFTYWNIKERKKNYVSAQDLGETFWDILSQYQKRIAVMNVPMTYPPHTVNGSLISGILTPSLESNFTWPQELKKQILEKFPEYHIFDLKKLARLNPAKTQLSDFINQMQTIIQNRTAVALWLLEKEPLDAFMVHFQATDVLQHVYWHFLDNSHPLFEKQNQLLLFKEFYHSLDQKILSIHQCFCKKNGEPLTVVLSDHGFQSHYKRFNLGNWLASEGYLNTGKNAAVRPHKTPSLKKLTHSLRIGKILKYFVPQTTIENIDKKFISKSETILWDKSKAFSIGRSNEGFIYLLTIDKTEKMSLAKEIRQKLLQFHDSENNKPIAQNVWFKDQIYKGKYLDRLPDIIIEPSEGYSFTGSYQFEEGLFHSITTQNDIHMGRHHSEGIIIMAGDMVRQKHNIVATIIDIVPTLLYCLGIPISEQMDGIVHKEIFKPSFHPALNMLHGMKNIEFNKSFNYTQEESKKIEQRLRDLGYL